jgi:hypothetical protein
MKRIILFTLLVSLSVFALMFDRLGVHEFLQWFIGPLFTFLIRIGFYHHLDICDR